MSTGYYQTPSFAPPRPVNIPQFQPPTLNLPQVSTTPPPQSLNAPNAGQENFYQQTLDPGNAAYLGKPYEAQCGNIISQARQGLAGFGGYSIADSGALSYNPNAQMGEAQRGAVNSARDQTPAALQSSSFRDRNIGAALGRVNQAALQVLNQYASAMTSSYGAEGQQLGTVTSGLLGLYGQDIANALDPSKGLNPPQDVLNAPPEAPQPDVTVPAPYGPASQAAQDGLYYGLPFNPGTTGRPKLMF